MSAISSVNSSSQSVDWVEASAPAASTAAASEAEIIDLLSSSPPTSSSANATPSTEEIEQLRQENEALRRALIGFKKQLNVNSADKAVSDESKGATAANLKSLHHSLSTPEGTSEFYGQLRV